MQETKFKSEFPKEMPGSAVFYPNDGRRHPGVVLLHGSEGASFPYWMVQAAELAGEGFVVLAFAYSGMRRLEFSDLHSPNTELSEVELSKTLDAVQWLRCLDVCSGKVALAGTSRGAEQALILASLAAKHRPEVVPDAVAVHAPSHIVESSHNFQWMNPTIGPDDWQEQFHGVPKSKELRPAWLWLGETDEVKIHTEIEIERYEGPVFLSHGELDPVWGVERAHAIVERLKRAGREPEMHVFKEQGHILRGKDAHDRKALFVDFLSRNMGTIGKRP